MEERLQKRKQCTDTTGWYEQQYKYQSQRNRRSSSAKLENVLQHLKQNEPYLKLAWPIKLLVGLRKIIAREAVELKAEIEAVQSNNLCSMLSIPNGRSNNKIDSPRALGVPLTALAINFGLVWNFEVSANEFDLDNDQLEQLQETFAKLTLGEVLSLALSIGTTKFVAGPFDILTELVVTYDVTPLYTGLFFRATGSTDQVEPYSVHSEQTGLYYSTEEAESISTALDLLVFGLRLRIVRWRGSGAALE